MVKNVVILDFKAFVVLCVFILVIKHIAQRPSIMHIARLICSAPNNLDLNRPCAT